MAQIACSLILRDGHVLIVTTTPELSITQAIAEVKETIKEFESSLNVLPVPLLKQD